MNRLTSRVLQSRQNIRKRVGLSRDTILSHFQAYHSSIWSFESGFSKTRSSFGIFTGSFLAGLPPLLGVVPWIKFKELSDPKRAEL